MIRVMFDSTDPAAIPAAAQLVAGYIDGQYAWDAAGWQRHAGKRWVRINVTGDPAHGGDCLDVERGDATPKHAPAWYDARRKAGARNLAVYCDRANLDAVNAAMGQRSFYRWVATLDGSLHVPGFAALRAPAAVQFAGASAAGADVDVSLVYEDSWHAEPSLAQVVAALKAEQASAAAALAALARYQQAA